MKIQYLFELYQKQIESTPNTDSIFEQSGMKNEFNKLDYGFFPLGSGILSNNSSIDIAETSEDGIMILGNDFGTMTYVQNDCKKNREGNSKTINNLKRLNLNLEKAFFTNFYLGLRDNINHSGAGMTKRVVQLTPEYKSFCYKFFLTQLKTINPKTVVCLGRDVINALNENSDLFIKWKNVSFKKSFSDENEKNYEIRILDSILGNRKFICIPHPSFAHANWKNNIEKKIISSLNES